MRTSLLFVLVPPAPDERWKAVSKLRNELHVKWQKEYFGAW